MTYQPSSRTPLRETLTFDPWEWVEIKDGNRHAFGMARRHYSAKKNKHPKVKLFIGPGGKLALLTRNGAALFAWRKYINDGGQEGVNCAIYRLEDSSTCHNSSHSHCSSNLIMRADAIAWQRWPGERLYTYVDPAEIGSANPGYCFKRAGWTYCGKTAEGLHILELLA